MVGEAKPMQSLRGPGGNLRDLTSLRVFVRVVELKSFSEVIADPASPPLR